MLVLIGIKYTEFGNQSPYDGIDCAEAVAARVTSERVVEPHSCSSKTLDAVGGSGTLSL